jgi:cytochrome oxidase assembly protein ShyY1
VYKFLLRPKWIAFHVLIVALVTIMLMLANWQLDRHHQRVAFNETLIERVDAPTAPLEKILNTFPTASDAEWRSVQVVGTYLKGFDLRVVNVSQGGRPGFDPVTPLQMSDGRLILINRGFIPLGATVQEAPTGTVTLQGRLRASPIKRLGAISDASSGVLTEVQRIDIARLQPQMPSPLVNVYLEMHSSAPADDATLSRIAEPSFSNGSHLGYVGQWILFSLCALGGWFAIVRREVTGKKKSTLGV